MGRGGAVDVERARRAGRPDAGLGGAVEDTLLSRRLAAAITIVTVPILITESTIGDG